jgi:hypothetical protein
MDIIVRLDVSSFTFVIKYYWYDQIKEDTNGTCENYKILVGNFDLLS